MPPDPAAIRPAAGLPGLVLLAPLAAGRPHTEVGDYTYYYSGEAPERFFETNVLYHWPFVGDRLVIGRFCALAHGVRFLMDGANHPMAGFSTYPFEILSSDWVLGDEAARAAAERRAETRVGHDVWLGHGATVLAGARIGSGAVIGAGAVVAGNPARVVRMRYDPQTVERLLALAWWDWPAARITRALAPIRGADLAALEAAA